MKEWLTFRLYEYLIKNYMKIGGTAMKKSSECRYFVTDTVAVPVIRTYKKGEAYRQATGDGWGTVYTDSEGTLICDEDSSAILISEYGEYTFIYPYDELKKNKWLKQAECRVIIHDDACGMDFWEAEPGLTKIYVTYDRNGFIDTYRLTDWTDNGYDGETLVKFEDLPEVDPYSEIKAEKFNSESNGSANVNLYNQIAQNYAAYDIGLNSPEEMLVLLNILEAHGETLEDVANFTSHALDNVINDVYSPDVTRKDIVETLMECNVFFDGKKPLCVMDHIHINEGLSSGRIIKTTNGYVEINII